MDLRLWAVDGDNEWSSLLMDKIMDAFYNLTNSQSYEFATYPLALLRGCFQLTGAEDLK